VSSFLTAHQQFCDTMFVPFVVSAVVKLFYCSVLGGSHSGPI